MNLLAVAEFIRFGTSACYSSDDDEKAIEKRRFCGRHHLSWVQIPLPGFGYSDSQIE
jgi:hypothetical protein